MGKTLWADGAVLNSIFLGGIVGNVVAAVAYEALAHGARSMRRAALQRLLSGSSGVNHDLLRAMRYAEAEALELMCDLTLIEDKRVQPNLLQSVSDEDDTDKANWLSRKLERARTFVTSLTARFTDPEVRLILAIRRDLRSQKNRFHKATPAELEEHRSVLAGDASRLLNGASEAVPGDPDHPDFERTVTTMVIGSLRRTVPELPAALVDRIRDHWLSTLRQSFRNRLKTDSAARHAFQNDILSHLNVQLDHVAQKLDQIGEEQKTLPDRLVQAMDGVADRFTDRIAARLEADRRRTGDTGLEGLAARDEGQGRVVGNLPTRDDYVIRPGELERLAGLLVSPEGRRCVVVCGPPGMGKTPLAILAAHLAKDSFPDGAVIVDARSPDFLQALMAELHLTAVDGSTRELQRCLAQRRICVILDGAVDARVGAVCAWARTSFVIVTTQDRHLGELLQLPPSQCIELLGLPESGSLDALRHFVGSPQRVDAEIDSARRLVGLLGNSPHAIRCVGMHLRLHPGWSIAHWVQRLTSAGGDFAAIRVRGAADLEATRPYAIAIEGLSARERDLLARLTTCRGFTFSWRSALAFVRGGAMPAAKSDAGTGTAPSRLQDRMAASPDERERFRVALATGPNEDLQVREDFENLFRYCIVDPARGRASNRFELHSLVLPVAKSLVGEEDPPAWRAAYARFFAAATIATDPARFDQCNALMRDIEDLRQVVAWMQRGDVAPDWAFAYHLEQILEGQQRSAQALQLCEAMVAVAQRTKHALAEIEFRIKITKYLRKSDRAEATAEHLTACEGLLSRLDETTRPIMTCILGTQRAVILARSGEAAQKAAAIDLLDEMVTIAERTGEQRQVHYVKTARANLLGTKGLADLQAAAEFALSAQEWTSYAVASTAFAQRLAENDRVDDARRVAESTLTTVRDRVPSANLVRLLRTSARLALRQGDHAGALVHLEENLRHHHDQPFGQDGPKMSARHELLVLMVRCCQALGDTERAIALQRQAVGIALRLDHAKYEAGMRHLRQMLRSSGAKTSPSADLLGLLLEIGEPEEMRLALATVAASREQVMTVTDAQRLVAELGGRDDPPALANASATLARSLAAAGDASAATAQWQIVVDLRHATRETGRLADAYLGLAQAQAAQGLVAAAIESLERSRDRIVGVEDLHIGADGAVLAVQLARESGDAQTVQDLVEGVTALAERIGGMHGQGERRAAILLSCAAALVQAGFQTAVARVVDVAVRVATDADNEWLIGRALNLRMQSSLILGLDKQAAADADRAGSILAHIEDRSLRCRLLRTIGFVRLRTGEFEATRKVWQSGLELARAANDANESMRFMLQGALVDSRSGQILRSQPQLEQVVGHATAQGDTAMELVALPLLATCHAENGRPDLAKAALSRARALTHDLHRVRARAQICTQLAALHTRLGELDEAEVFLEEAAAAEGAVGDPRRMARVLSSRANLLLRQEDYAAAEGILLEILDIERAGPNRRGEALVLHELARARSYQGKLAEAEADLRASLAIGEQIPDLRHQAMTLETLGATLYRMRRHAESLEFRQRSVAIGEQRADRRHLTIGYRGVVKSALACRNWRAAEEALIRLVRLDAAAPEPDARRRETIGELIAEIHRIGRLGTMGRLRQEAPQWVEGLPASHPCVTGRIKKLGRGKDGKPYAFIAPDDGGADVFCGAEFVDDGTWQQLAVGIAVQATVRVSPRGQRQVVQIELAKPPDSAG